TPAERALWAALRANRLAGLKFRRQYPLGPYILDFTCLERRLIIEVDGPIHEDQQAEDTTRTEALATLGYRVLRVTNDAILTNLPEVLDQIAVLARNLP